MNNICVRNEFLDGVMMKYGEDPEVVEAIETLLDKASKMIMNGCHCDGETSRMAHEKGYAENMALRLLLGHIELITNEHGETWLYDFMIQYAGLAIEACAD